MLLEINNSFWVRVGIKRCRQKKEKNTDFFYDNNDMHMMYIFFCLIYVIVRYVIVFFFDSRSYEWPTYSNNMLNVWACYEWKGGIKERRLTAE